jgi:hypothetical protein
VVQSWTRAGDIISAICATISAIFAYIVLLRLRDAGKLKVNLSTLAVTSTALSFILSTLGNLLQAIRCDGYYAAASTPSHTWRPSSAQPIEQVPTFACIPSQISISISCIYQLFDDGHDTTVYSL